jgi:hypothetical protein
MLHEDDLYIVIGPLGIAVSLDHTGGVYQMPMFKDGTPDWDSEWDIEWDELNPTEYALYKTAYDCLTRMDELSVKPNVVFVK